MGVMCTSIIVEDITDNSKSLASDPWGSGSFSFPLALPKWPKRDMRTVCGMLLINTGKQISVGIVYFNVRPFV